MSAFDDLDVLFAIGDVGIDPLVLEGLDQRITELLRETPLPGRRRLRAGHVGRLMFPVVALVPVLVVIAVIGLLSGSQGSISHGGSLPGMHPIIDDRQVLLRTLGVLRRAPDSASRRAIACITSSPKLGSPEFRDCRTSPISMAFTPFPGAARFGASSGVRLDTPLIRVVPVPAVGDSIALVPATAPASPGSHRRREGLEVFISFHDGAASPGPTPTSVEEVQAHGLAVSGTNATPTMRSVVGAVIVPDGVATVTLEPIGVFSAAAPIDPRRFGMSTAAVHDNVASYRFAVPAVHAPHHRSLVQAVTVVTKETWRDQHHAVIANTTIQLQLWLKVHGNNGPIHSTN